MPIGSNILAGASGQSTGYDIDQSLRFEDGDTAYLNRTPSASNRKTWTYSFWFKRSGIDLADHGSVLNVHAGNNDNDFISLEFVKSGANEDTFRVSWWYNSIITSQVFRDPSSWGHLIIACDTTQSTASDRVKFYYNGEQITSFASANYPSQNANTAVNAASAHVIGEYTAGADHYDGYLAEVHFIDGQALTPASFGETNSATNQWVPIEYTGSYGTNGFYLKFQDSSALGDDSSGNTNDFTSSGLAATDQMLDSPTNNFATLNPLDQGWSESSNAGVNSEGNLKTSNTAGGWWAPRASIGQDSGKWYFEVLALASNTYMQCGIEEPENNGEESGNSYRYRSNGNKYAGSGAASYGATWSSSGDIIGVAMNLDDNEVTFYKNNSSQGAISIASGVTYQPVVVVASSGIVCANFGQDSSFAGNKTAQGNTDANGIGDFYYTPPSGFVALCEDNLPDPSIALPGDHFNTVLGTGTGSTQSITGVGFQPDFLWIKRRNAAINHALYDVIRGGTNALRSNTTAAESQFATDTVITFESDGFEIAGGATLGFNGSGDTFASYNWKAGGTASSNTDGSITSSVSANTDAGFSIVSYTGTTSNATVGHGLSQAPELVIVKPRSYADNWRVGSDELTSWVYHMRLNTTVAETSYAAIWNSTAPTSSVFNVGTDGTNGVSGATYIAYCFHSVDGYSKVGTYESNNVSDGPFIYTGFSPAFMLFKNIDGTEAWSMFDTARNTINGPDAKLLMPSASSAESSTANRDIDFLSNGFKIRASALNPNTGTNTYIFLAMASSPFKTSNAR